MQLHCCCFCLDDGLGLVFFFFFLISQDRPEIQKQKTFKKYRVKIDFPSLRKADKLYPE